MAELLFFILITGIVAWPVMSMLALLGMDKNRDLGDGNNSGASQLNPIAPVG